jgi:hypothetical protein
MPDGGACPTRAVTGPTQTKIRRRKTRYHRARPEKRWSVTTRAPRSRELPSAWTPRTDHRRPIRQVLTTVGAENVGERSWWARVNQKSAETCRSGFQDQRKKMKKRGQKIPSDEQILSIHRFKSIHLIR